MVQAAVSYTHLILSDLKGWKFGTFESEFKSDVYFVSLRNFQNNK